MWIKKRFEITDACSLAGVEQKTMLLWIQNEWISLADPVTLQLDDEDIARARLIYNLQSDFGVNDEGISIVLHLLDQLHHLQNRIREE